MCDPRQELRNATRTVRKITGNIAANVESIARNPLPMLATLALTAAGVPAPIANAAVTVANGGDMNDIIKSAATAYAAQGIGKATGDLLPSDYQTTDPQYALQENIRQIVTSASGNAAVAAIQNRPLSEVLAAATSGAVSSVVRQELMDQGINPGDVSSKLLSSSISAATKAILTGKDWTQAVGQSLATVGIQTSISTGIDYLRNLSTTNDALVSDYNDARDKALRLQSSASMAVNDRNATAYKYNEYLQYVNNFATETERAVDMQTRLGNMAQTGDFSGITSAERDIVNQWYGGNTENWVLNQYRSAQAQIQGYNDRMPDMLNDLGIRKAQYDSAETDFNKKNTAYEDSLAFVNGLADQITSNANLITEKTQEIADLTAQYNTSVAADIEKYLGTQAANEITKTLNTSNDTAKEIVAGTQQLIDAITNPQSTVSYPGTQLADVGKAGDPGSGVYWDSSIGAWRVADEPTAEDLDQLGVGLPTNTGPTYSLEELIAQSDTKAQEAGFPDYETQKLYRGDIDAYNRDVAHKAMLESMDPTERAYLNYRDQQEGGPGFTSFEDFKKYGGDYSAYQRDQIGDGVTDDGTTEDIQDIIDQQNRPTDTGTTLTGDDGSTVTINPDGSVSSTDATDTGSQDTQTGGQGTDTVQNGAGADVVQDDRTTKDIQDIIDTTTGGSLGDESDLPPTDTEKEPQCAPGFHWNGSLCVADTDVNDETTTCPAGYIFDLATQTCVPIGGTDNTKLPTDTTKLPTDTTKLPTDTTKLPTDATKLPTDATKKSTGLDLASLLALLGAGQGQQAPTPPPTVDIGEQLDLEAPLQTNPFAKKQTQSKMATGGSIDDLLALLQQRG